MIRSGLLAIVSVPLILLSGSAGAAPFIRGDMNRDGALDITDPIHGLISLFADPVLPEALCPDAVDANDDGRMDISDMIHVLYFLFMGGDRPPPPYPFCGEDPTEDSMGCVFEGPCPAGPEAVLVARSACKGEGGGDGDPSGEECLEWSHDGSVLAIRHRSGGFNCCSEVTVACSIVDGAVSIVETESGALCLCECLFDLDLEVRGLPPGPYTIRVSGGLGPGLEAAVDLSAEPSGSRCEERTGYPWGL